MIQTLKDPDIETRQGIIDALGEMVPPTGQAIRVGNADPDQQQVGIHLLIEEKSEDAWTIYKSTQTTSFAKNIIRC